MSNWLTIETRGGEPIATRGITITPFTRTLTVRFPGRKGGLIWNRLQSILVTGASGEEEIIPIRDITRYVQWTLYAAAALSAALFWLFRPKSMRDRT